jgi:hypothetical protein
VQSWHFQRYLDGLTGISAFTWNATPVGDWTGAEAKIGSRGTKM